VPIDFHVLVILNLLNCFELIQAILLFRVLDCLITMIICYIVRFTIVIFRDLFIYHRIRHRIRFFILFLIVILIRLPLLFIFILKFHTLSRD